MNLLDLAAVAITNIRGGFMLKPRLEPADVVVSLDNRLHLSKESRGKILPYKEDLYKQARLTMAEDFDDLIEDIPEVEAEFTAYFEEVFDLFVDPERTVRDLSQVKL